MLLYCFALGTRKQQLDEALVDMVAKDSQPFTVVEDEGFRGFVQKLDPTYILPSRQVCMGVCVHKHKPK